MKYALSYSGEYYDIGIDLLTKKTISDDKGLVFRFESKVWCFPHGSQKSGGIFEFIVLLVNKTNLKYKR